MRIRIKPEIFKGSILEGMPVSFEWKTRRPKNVYYVGPNGVVMRNYDDWYPIAINHTKERLRMMFYHDFGHMIYMARNGGIYDLHKSNFGRTWEYVHRNPDGIMVYEIKEHFIEEIRVGALEYIISKRENENYEHAVYADFVSNRNNYKDFHYQDDTTDPIYLAERKEIIDSAYEYWTEYGIDNVYHLADRVKNFLKDNVVPKAA